MYSNGFLIVQKYWKRSLRCASVLLYTSKYQRTMIRDNEKQFKVHRNLNIRSIISNSNMIHNHSNIIIIKAPGVRNRCRVVLCFNHPMAAPAQIHHQKMVQAYNVLVFFFQTLSLFFLSVALFCTETFW